MLLVVTSPSYNADDPTDNAIPTKMLGVALAAASSGGGEMTFLAMTHFYGPFSLAGWGSGTGAAGLVGAGAYALATTGLGLSSRGTLFASAFLPCIMVGTFFLVLPWDRLKRKGYSKRLPRDPFKTHDEAENADLIGDVAHRGDEEGEEEDNNDDDDDHDVEEEGLLRASTTSAVPVHKSSKSPSSTTILHTNLNQMRQLFLP